MKIIVAGSEGHYRRMAYVGRIAMKDTDIRTALDRHWAASAAGDLAAEHDIYCVRPPVSH